MLLPWLAVARAHNPHDPVDDLAVGPDGRIWALREPAANWRVTELAASDDDGWWFRRVGRGLADPAPLVGVEVAGDVVIAWSERTLWRSDDAGATFRAAFAADAGERLLSAVVAPDGGGVTVFAGTTERLVRSRAGGPFDVLAASPAAHLALTGDLAAGGVVAAASGGLVVVSADGGDAWTEAGRGLPTVHALAVGAGELWVGTETGAWRRPDPASPLAPIAALAGERVDLVAASPTAATDHTWFLATATGGLHHTTDGGATVTALPTVPELSPQSDVHWFELGFGPGWPTEPTLWLGTFEGLYTSTDGGSTWSERDVRPPPLINAIALSPSFAEDGGVAVGTYDAGLSVSDDRGDRFAPRTVGLVHSSVYGLDWAAERDGSTTLLAGMLAHLSLLPVEDPAAGWRNEVLGDQGSYATRAVASPAFADDGTVFVGSRTHGLWRTTDRGATWSAVWPHEGPTASIAISPAFATDRTLLVSSIDGGVWRSVDGGDTFSEVAVDASWAFLAPSAAPGVFLAGGASGLHRSDDGGATFAPVAAAPGGPIDAVAWAGDHTVYVAARDGTLARSDDDGATFAPIGPDLAAADVFLVELAPSPAHDDDGTVFGSDGDQLWRSTDRGASWARIDPDPVRYEESTQAVRIRGGRDTLDDAASCRGRVTLSGDDAVGFDFVGRRVRILGPTGRDGGSAVVHLDGVRHVLDASGPDRALAVLLELTVADDGPHALVLEPSPGESIVVDAFEVVQRPELEPPGPHSAEDTGTAPAHTGTRADRTDPVDRADDGEGCGCGAAPGPAGAWVLVAALAVRSRRRNETRRISDPG